MSQILIETKNRMKEPLSLLDKNLSSLSVGKITNSFLDTFTIDFYGKKTPISQVGTVTILSLRSFSVKVWDKSVLNLVENSFRNSNYNFNPLTNGDTIKIILPKLTEERRKEIVKIASVYTENSRIFIRNIRRESISFIKKEEKNSSISKDTRHHLISEIQKITDNYIKKVENLFLKKENDILQI